MSPVCLPDTPDTKNEDFEGIRCIAAGWGRTTVTTSGTTAGDDDSLAKDENHLKEVRVHKLK